MSASPRTRLRASTLSAFVALLLGLSGAAHAQSATGWLRTQGNRIVTEDGQVWLGRGANLHDTRSCNACTSQRPDRDEVIRRVDELVDVWGANFIRLVLESYGSSSVLTDPSYLADIEAIVDHIGTKPGVYVMVSLWHDPSFTDLGWPSSATATVWEQLAHTFANDPHVLYGLVNEPQHNYDGAQNAAVWQAMNNTVAAIRAVEDELGAPHHIVAVQGTGGWARFLDYYTTHPITAGGGENVAYEVHVYDPASTFDDRFIRPSQTLPVIIGEFGPMHGMSMNDVSVLMDRADELGVPYLAWTFHMRCPPNLLVDYSNGGCGVDMRLEPTDWGRLLKDRLARSMAPQPAPQPEPEPAPQPQPVEPAPPTSAGYDPGFRMNPNSNEWWVEVFADADSIEVEVEGSGRRALSRTSWGSFALNEHVARGTRIRFLAKKGALAAASSFFAFLEGQPTLASSAGDGSTGSAPPAPSYDPGLRLGENCNEWWVEVYADADSVTLLLESGERRPMRKNSWGSFSSNTYVRRGTRIRFEAKKGTETATSSYVRYLQ